MSMRKVVEVPNAKMATSVLVRWKKWTRGRAKKMPLANGWYAIYADTSRLKPATRLILGFPKKE